MRDKTRVYIGAAVLLSLAVTAYAFGYLGPAALSGVSGLALALTVPPTFPARNTGEQQLHFFRFRFQFGQITALAAGQKIGRLPARSFIHSIKFYKATAFNSATTDTLQLGTTAAGVDILAATSIAAAGYADLTAAAGLGIVVGTAAEVDIFAKYAQTGAAATVGDMTIVIAYIPDIDQ